MVNSGDLCLLNNVFPGFHISGVCSDIRSFNRILHWIWMLLTKFDRDATDSATNSTTFFTVSPSAVYNCRMIESSPRLQPKQINRVAQTSSADSLRFRFVHDENARLFIPFKKLRNNLYFGVFLILRFKSAITKSLGDRGGIFNVFESLLSSPSINQCLCSLIIYIVKIL